MPFDWKEFFTLAERLAKDADEASQRTAIGRAYYSVFNVAFARAESTAGKYPGGVSSHAWCWEKYTAAVSKECQRIGNTGGRLKRMRVQADYISAGIPRLEDEVRRVIMDATSLSFQLSALDPRLP